MGSENMGGYSMFRTKRSGDCVASCTLMHDTHVCVTFTHASHTQSIEYMELRTRSVGASPFLAAFCLLLCLHIYGGCLGHRIHLSSTHATQSIATCACIQQHALCPRVLSKLM